MDGESKICTSSKVTYLLLVLFGINAIQTTYAERDVHPDEQLISQINYWFVGHLGQMDDEGRSLIWEASIEGDLKGKIKWWFLNPPPASAISYQGGRMSFYAARWELWVDDQLVLAGETAGKTVFPDDSDGTWDGHGRVTKAEGSFEALIGRRVYESGPVLLGQDPPKTFSGTGVFLIY